VAVNFPVSRDLMAMIIIKEFIANGLKAIGYTKVSPILILILVRTIMAKNADRIIIRVKYIVVSSIGVVSCSSEA